MKARLPNADPEAVTRVMEQLAFDPAVDFAYARAVLAAIKTDPKIDPQIRSGAVLALSQLARTEAEKQQRTAADDQVPALIDHVEAQVDARKATDREAARNNIEAARKDDPKLAKLDPTLGADELVNRCVELLARARLTLNFDVKGLFGQRMNRNLLLNQWEKQAAHIPGSGTSLVKARGYDDKRDRVDQELAMGSPLAKSAGDKDFNPHLRPKTVGVDYRTRPDGAAARWGKSFFVLSPELRSRCTFTFADSFHAHDTGAATGGGAGNYVCTASTLAALLKGDVKLAASILSVAVLQEDYSTQHFVEAQVYGSIDFAKHVDAVYLDPGALQDDSVRENVRAFVERNKLKVFQTGGAALDLGKRPGLDNARDQDKEDDDDDDDNYDDAVGDAPDVLKLRTRDLTSSSEAFSDELDFSDEEEAPASKAMPALSLAKRPAEAFPDELDFSDEEEAPASKAMPALSLAKQPAETFPDELDFSDDEDSDKATTEATAPAPKQPSREDDALARRVEATRQQDARKAELRTHLLEKVDDPDFVGEYVKSSPSARSYIETGRPALEALTHEVQALRAALGSSKQITADGTPKINPSRLENSELGAKQGGAPSTDFLFAPSVLPENVPDAGRTGQSFDDFKRADLGRVLDVYHATPRNVMHNRLHIARAEVLARAMANFVHATTSKSASSGGAPKVDMNAIQYGVALHDSGRRSEGADIYEHESARNAFSYVKALGHDDDYAGYIARMIVKDEARPHQPDLNEQIVHDADTLEILRVLRAQPGGRAAHDRETLLGKDGKDGKDGTFDRSRFKFLAEDGALGMDDAKRSQVREELLADALSLIELTEASGGKDTALRTMFSSVPSNEFLGVIEQIMQTHAARLPFLSSYYFLENGAPSASKPPAP